MKIRIKKLSENATTPTYATALSAGCDLYACLLDSILVRPHETVKIPTGLSIELPSDKVALIYARSGLATKKGLAPANKVGVIDADYRGEIIISIHNHSNTPQTIEPKERIAQLVITNYYQAEFEEVDSLSETERGEGGFGSTGTK